MTIEAAAGISAGVAAASIALTGWALSSAVEGLASVIVIWRFTGTRTLSETAEARAQKGVAVSFWLLAPYVTIEAMHNLLTGQKPGTSVAGIAVTALAVVIMPVLGIAKRRLGRHLGSGATAGEGTQNLLCAYLGAAVLISLAANAAFGWWWLDPIAGRPLRRPPSGKASNPGTATAATADSRRGRTSTGTAGIPAAPRAQAFAAGIYQRAQHSRNNPTCSAGCPPGEDRASTREPAHSRPTGSSQPT